MKTLEVLRNKAFWTIDFLKGGPIRTQLKDIEFMMNNWGTLEVSRKRELYLRKMLEYVVNNIDYYKDYKKCIQLSDFPVVNKNIIRDNEDRFFNKRFDKKELFRQATSGSTGTPFVIYQDKIKRNRATADTLFFSQFANYKLGNRLYFSRVWEQGTERSKITQFLQNWITHDSSHLSDEDIRRLLLDLENDSSTKNVLLFASTLSSIAKYVENNNIFPKTNIESFITVSESLDLRTKEIIKKRFKTQVVSRYSDQELGIMAQQCFQSHEFHLNIASFYFELLDFEKDIPVPLGEPGRIVVTDFFNHSMPLVRYDTGDIGVMKICADCPNKTPVFERIDGRRVDFIYDTMGNLVSPYVINSPMHVYTEIQQYQFVQENANYYIMFLNMIDNCVFKKEKEMVDMLRHYLGEDAIIKVRYVAEIPVLKSGKRKQVVNNYKK